MRTSLLPKETDIEYVQEAELTFQCPVCLAMETLFLEDGILTETRYWKQYKDKVYHRDCGRPARLINMYKRKVAVPSTTAVFLSRMLDQNQESIRQLAVNIGISRITVKRWLLGINHPNRTHRKRIMRYAKISRMQKELRV